MGKWKVHTVLNFDEWWESLSEDEHVELTAVISLLRELGPTLRFPYTSGISGSKIKSMRELRIQYKGDPYRILYAFDPERAAGRELFVETRG